MMKKNILIIDDEKESRFVTKYLLKNTYQIIEAGNKVDSLTQLESHAIQAVILDLLMPDVVEFELLTEIKSRFPGVPVIMLTSFAQIQKAVQAIKLGADDYIVKETAENTLSKSLELLFLNQKLRHDIQAYQEEFKTLFTDIYVPNHPAYQKTFQMACHALDAGLNLLVLGETGTGKDVLARYVHQKLKPKSPLISLNCGAICSTLAESELFGYEKGAFTDAKETKIGKFELAHEGILFLDEIGNMSLSIQGQLLRIIEDKKLVRVGGNKEIPVDFLLITATNKNLSNAISKGEFRQDLFYRVNQVSVEMPSLSQYPQVIQEFALFFIEKFNQKYQTDFKLTPYFSEYLTNKPWPGNIRELQNEIQMKVAFHQKGVVWDHPPVSPASNIPPSPSTPFNLSENLKLIEKEYIQKALKKNKMNISKSAKQLGLNRTTLIRKLNMLEKLKK